MTWDAGSLTPRARWLPSDEVRFGAGREYSYRCAKDRIAEEEEVEPRISTPKSHEKSALPLTLPRELWEPLPREQRQTLRHAQRVLDQLTAGQVFSLADIDRKTRLGAPRILRALHALSSMNLVTVGAAGDDVMIRLIAVPDEHVRIVGPDEQARWIFVTRPVEEPEVDPLSLN